MDNLSISKERKKSSHKSRLLPVASRGLLGYIYQLIPIYYLDMGLDLDSLIKTSWLGGGNPSLFELSRHSYASGLRRDGVGEGGSGGGGQPFHTRYVARATTLILMY